MNEQQYIHDATVMLAASVLERSGELIADGWVKGRFYKMVEKDVPVAFCILGAFEQALDELMPKASYSADARREIIDIATVFVLDEVENQTNKKVSSIPGWNDAGERTQEEVLSVIGRAAARLWEISFETSEATAQELAAKVSAAAQVGAGLREKFQTTDLN